MEHFDDVLTVAPTERRNRSLTMDGKGIKTLKGKRNIFKHGAKNRCGTNKQAENDKRFLSLADEGYQLAG